MSAVITPNEIRLTPQQVAEAFWSMDSHGMADFFAELERIASYRLCLQMAHVVNEIADRADLHNYDAMHGFQTMLSHAAHYSESSTEHRAARAKADCQAKAFRASIRRELSA